MDVNEEAAEAVLKAIREAMAAGVQAAEREEARDAAGYVAAHPLPAITVADLLAYAYTMGYRVPAGRAVLYREWEA